MKELSCDNYFLSTYHEEKEAYKIKERIFNAQRLNLNAIMPLQDDILGKVPNAILTSLTLSMQHYKPDFIKKATKLKSISLILENEKYNPIFPKAMDEMKGLTELEKVYLEGDFDVITKKLIGFTMKSNAVFSIKATNVKETTLTQLSKCQINDITICIKDEMVNQSVYPYITRMKVIEGKEHYRIFLMPSGTIELDAKETHLNCQIIKQILPTSVIVTPGSNAIEGIQYTQQYINYNWTSLTSISFQKIHFNHFLPELSNELQYINFTECKLPERLALPQELTAITINNCDTLHTLQLNNKLCNLVIKKVHSLHCIQYETDDMNTPCLTHVAFDQCSNLGSTLLPYSIRIFNSSHCKNLKIKNANKFHLFDPIMWHVLVQLRDDETKTSN